VWGSSRLVRGGGVVVNLLKKYTFAAPLWSAAGPGRVKIAWEARNWSCDGAFCATEIPMLRNQPQNTPDAPGGLLQVLICSRRPWPHARIASSNPPTPTIIITRFML